MTGRGFMERHARRMHRRRWWVVAAWIAFMVVALGLASRVGEVTTTEVTLPGTEGQAGYYHTPEHAHALLVQLHLRQRGPASGPSRLKFPSSRWRSRRGHPTAIRPHSSLTPGSWADPWGYW